MIVSLHVSRHKVSFKFIMPTDLIIYNKILPASTGILWQDAFGDWSFVPSACPISEAHTSFLGQLIFAFSLCFTQR